MKAAKPKFHSNFFHSVWSWAVKKYGNNRIRNARLSRLKSRYNERCEKFNNSSPLNLQGSKKTIIYFVSSCSLCWPKVVVVNADRTFLWYVAPTEMYERMGLHKRFRKCWVKFSYSKVNGLGWSDLILSLLISVCILSHWIFA